MEALQPNRVTATVSPEKPSGSKFYSRVPMSLLVRFASSSLRPHVSRTVWRTIATEAETNSGVSPQQSSTIPPLSFDSKFDTNSIFPNTPDQPLSKSEAKKRQNETNDLTNWKPTPDGPLRPKMPHVTFRDSHPLHAFFRYKVEKIQPDTTKGEDEVRDHARYMTLEAPHAEEDESGMIGPFSFPCIQTHCSYVQGGHGRPRNCEIRAFMTYIHCGMFWPESGICLQHKRHLLGGLVSTLNSVLVR